MLNGASTGSWSECAEFATNDCDTLLDLHQQVRREREDPNLAIWRTIEAPVELMERLAEFIYEIGYGARMVPYPIGNAGLSPYLGNAQDWPYTTLLLYKCGPGRA